jgi:hypothetical protein
VIVLAISGWAILSLLFFLLFSVPLSGQERPAWYGLTTYVLEEVAFLVAGILCFRNWRSAQIVSGRSIWLAMGLGMFSYFIGNLFFCYWELGLGISPDISPGDFFFVITYFLLGISMLLAVISRRLNLALMQWALVVLILLGSSAIALQIVPVDDKSADSTPAVEQTTPSPAATQATSKAPAVAPTPTPSPSPEADAPAWAVTVENTLAPFQPIVAWFYIVGDIFLVVMATILLLAFWGGRFSLSWRFIAAAAFSFYIADIWFAYATQYIPDYKSGSLPEVCWVFSGCLFAIGAALEYDLSTRSRRVSRRRT